MFIYSLISYETNFKVDLCKNIKSTQKMYKSHKHPDSNDDDDGLYNIKSLSPQEIFIQISRHFLDNDMV